MPGRAVSPAAHRELGARFPRHGDDVRDVGCIGDTDDRRGAAVEAGEEHTAGVLVLGIVGSDHVAAHACAKLVGLDIGMRLQASSWVDRVRCQYDTRKRPNVTSSGPIDEQRQTARKGLCLDQLDVERSGEPLEER